MEKPGRHFRPAVGKYALRLAIISIIAMALLLAGCSRGSSSPGADRVPETSPIAVASPPPGQVLPESLPSLTPDVRPSRVTPFPSMEMTPRTTPTPPPGVISSEVRRILPLLKTGKADRTSEYAFSFRNRQYTLEPRYSYATWADSRRIKSSMIVYDMNNGSAKIPEFDSPEEYLTEFYREMIFDPAQNDTFESILSNLRHIRDMQYLDDDEYVELMIVSVQRSFHYLADAGYPKYPVDLVASSQGDCDDKSLLLTGLLAREGYGVCLLSRPGHLALGILGDDDLYHYIEATDENGHYISDEPASPSAWRILPLTRGRQYGALGEVRYIRAVVSYVRNPSDIAIVSPSYDAYCDSIYSFIMDNVDDRHYVYRNLKERYPDVEKYLAS